jgi:hypothetical protein
MTKALIAKKESDLKLGTVAYTCNPTSWGGGEWEDQV